MERVVKFFGIPVCDNCKQMCVERVYDTKTIMGTWANLCSKCNSQIGVGNAEPFIWNESHNAFVMIKHVSDQAQFLDEECPVKNGCQIYKGDDDVFYFCLTDCNYYDDSGNLKGTDETRVYFRKHQGW